MRPLNPIIASEWKWIEQRANEEISQKKLSESKSWKQLLQSKFRDPNLWKYRLKKVILYSNNWISIIASQGAAPWGKKSNYYKLFWNDSEEISQKKWSESRRQLLKSKFRYIYQYNKNDDPEAPEKQQSRVKNPESIVQIFFKDWRHNPKARWSKTQNVCILIFTYSETY